ncbi:hypothetical protein GCM10010294_64750 [Streptomyces griseoloalbus]|nr:hypothetical protein GCM10010294_64750 [Streptomyces griseoloalbus]
MESPTAATDSGLVSHTGVGFGDGEFLAPVPDGAGESPPTASQPATPSAAAVTTASTARERRVRLRVACSIRRLPARHEVFVPPTMNNAQGFPLSEGRVRKERPPPAQASCRVNDGSFPASGPTVRHTPCAVAR